MVDDSKFSTHAKECGDALRGYAYCTHIITSSLKGSTISFDEKATPAITAVDQATKKAEQAVIPEGPQVVIDQIDDALRGWKSRAPAQDF
jgi:hypothetical protein